MKKQILTVVSVALAAILIFVVYTAFFKKDDIELVDDPFYSLTDETRTAVSGLENSHTLELKGYDVDDDGWVALQRMANAFRAANKKIKVKTSEADGFNGVVIDHGDRQDSYEYSAFFKTLYDGTRYAFDGEAVIANSLFAAEGKEKADIAPHAYSGFDTDGDYVTAAGMPFIFKGLDRSGIAGIKLTNGTGEYSIYQDEKTGNFYFGDSTVVTYDAEKFSILTTNCRYPVTYGKIVLPEDKDWKDYGLDADSPETCKYVLMTVKDANGNYFLHNVYIGKKAAAGSYYYARYVGGLLDGGNAILQNLSKNFVYYMPANAVEGSLDSPATDVLSAQLVQPLSSVQEVLNVQEVRLDYYADGINAVVKNLSAFTPAKNIAVADSSAISKIISDKVSAADYSGYAGGWKENTGVFAAFTSSDGSPTYLEAALARYSSDGGYTVRIGVLRDDANGALLPGRIYLTASDDGVNYVPVGDDIIPAQDDKTVKRYEFAFDYAERLRYLRVCFEVPQTAYSYAVFDEIRIYAGDQDAQPTDSTSGIWRLVSPDDYIAEGRNFAYLDMTTFNDLIQGIVALSGDKAVKCGISENGDAHKLDKALLAEYGLDEPDRHYAYTYDGVTTDIYISAPDENGVRYAYSTFTGELNGSIVSYTGDIIVELTETGRDWLGWDFFEILDHSLLSMYIAEIEDMTFSFDGSEYKFVLTATEDGRDIADVSYNGKSFDVKSFKYLYQSVLSVYMQDQYTPAEGETANEYLRVKINAETRSPELVFYRVSATKCYFTIDGEGSYYALAKSVNTVRDNVVRYVDGETITRPR